MPSLEVLQQELATFGNEHPLQGGFEREEFFRICAIYWLDRVLGHGRVLVQLRAFTSVKENEGGLYYVATA